MDEVGDLLRLKYSRLPRPVGPVNYEEKPLTAVDQDVWTSSNRQSTDKITEGSQKQDNQWRNPVVLLKIVLY